MRKTVVMYATSVKWGKWLLSHPPKFFPIPTAFQMSVGIFAKHSIKNVLQCDFLLYIFFAKGKCVLHTKYHSNKRLSFKNILKF